MLEVLVDEFAEPHQRLVVDKEAVDDVHLVAEVAEELVVLAYGVDELLADVGRRHVVVDELLLSDHGVVELQRCVEVVKQLIERVDALVALFVAHLHEGAAAGDLLRLVALHDYREAVDIVLFAIDAFEDGLCEEVEVAVSAHDVEHLRAGAAEHERARLGQLALLHHACDVVDQRDVEVDEDEFALRVFVESLVVAEDVVAAHHLIILYGEEEGVDVLALALRGDVVEDAVELAVAFVVGIEEAFEVVDVLHEHGVGVAVRHLAEAVAEEHIGCEAERREDDRLLGPGLEDHDVAGAAADVDAGDIGCRPAELTRRLIKIIRCYGLRHLDEVLVGGLDAEDLLERLSPCLSHLVDVAHLHGQRIEPHEACLRDVAILEQHLRAHELCKLGEIGADALCTCHVGGPLQIRDDAIAVADALLLVDERNVGVGESEDGIDVLGVEALGLADDGALREAVVVADVLRQELLLQDDIVEDLLAVVERCQQALRGCGAKVERSGHVVLLHAFEVGVGGSEVDGERECVVTGDMGCPARTDHALGSLVATLVGERDVDVVEVVFQTVVLRAHTLL